MVNAVSLILELRLVLLGLFDGLLGVREVLLVGLEVGFACRAAGVELVASSEKGVLLRVVSCLMRVPFVDFFFGDCFEFGEEIVNGNAGFFCPLFVLAHLECFLFLLFVSAARASKPVV